MHKVIIIDDEPLARQLIRSFLEAYNEIEIVAECGDGFEGYKLIQQHAPDLIFLDVQMPKISGFEMLELIDNPPAVIFTTAFDEFALKAFEAHAIDYLLKPITKERFDKAMKKWLQMGQPANNAGTKTLATEKVYDSYQNRIVVKDGSKIRIIPATTIHYIEASDDYIKIITPDGSFLKKITLSKIEEILDPRQFVRVHRSWLIPVSQLMKIEPYQKDSHIALLHNGAKLPVSKTGMARLKEVLGW